MRSEEKQLEFLMKAANLQMAFEYHEKYGTLTQDVILDSTIPFAKKYNLDSKIVLEIARNKKTLHELLELSANVTENQRFEEAYADLKTDNFPCCLIITYHHKTYKKETLHYTRSKEDLLDFWEKFCGDNNLDPLCIDNIAKCEDL